MKAARLEAPGTLAVEAVPEPEPGPREVLVDIEGCGVCGSDVPTWRGTAGLDYPLSPGAPGHEGWGRVAAVGERVEDLEEGRRVALLSYRAYAEFDVAPRDRVLPLPPELEGRAVPAEPLACAVNVARRAGVEAGDTVVVLGIGFLGALLLPLLRESGPRTIVAVSRRPTSLGMAERMGADEALTYGEMRRRLRGRDGDGLADVVVEATGKQEPLDLAGELCRVRGRLVVAGYHQDGPRSVDLRLWNWRGLDVVNAHERAPSAYMEGMRAGVERLRSGALDLEPLLTHRLPLDEIDRAFEAAGRRDEGFFKAVVMPGAGG